MSKTITAKDNARPGDWFVVTSDREDFVPPIGYERAAPGVWRHVVTGDEPQTLTLDDEDARWYSVRVGPG